MTYPSDFKPTKSIETVTQIFESNEFPFGDMLSGAKWEYSQSFPNHLVVFNANVLTKSHGKVWYGDLNLTEDYLVLKDIAKSLNSTLYVLWESDGRFGDENKPFDELIKKAVWNTTENKPTKEWYKKCCTGND